MAKQSNLSSFAAELAQAIPYLARFSRAMLGQRSDPLSAGKITLPQYIALNVLSVKELIKMKDIARAMRISLPAVTGLVNRLVRMKMVKRSYDSKDRRVIFIVLTSLGKKTTESVTLGRRRVIEELFSDLSDKEREIYITIIRKVKKIVYEKSEKAKQ